MTLRLERQGPRPDGIPGTLYVDGARFCDTLEDPPGKDKGPIPAGEYAVQITYSERFKRLLPLVESVPGFTGIRIHPGNTDADTEGCILLGFRRGQTCTLDDSRYAVAKLLNQWHGPVRISIIDPEAAHDV